LLLLASGYLVISLISFLNLHPFPAQ
jgi:hypothetical protein